MEIYHFLCSGSGNAETLCRAFKEKNQHWKLWFNLIWLCKLRQFKPREKIEVIRVQNLLLIRFRPCGTLGLGHNLSCSVTLLPCSEICHKHSKGSQHQLSVAQVAEKTVHLLFQEYSTPSS